MGFNLIVVYKYCVYFQTPLGAWPGKTQAHYATPGDLPDVNCKNKANNIRWEAVSSIMMQNWL